MWQFLAGFIVGIGATCVGTALYIRYWELKQLANNLPTSSDTDIINPQNTTWYRADGSVLTDEEYDEVNHPWINRAIRKAQDAAGPPPGEPPILDMRA